MLWLVLILAIVVGVFAGGRTAIRFARQADFDSANRALFVSGLVAACCGMLATFLTLGWPWKRVSESVGTELTKTVVKTVEVPVQVTRWLFFRGEEIVKKEVPTKVVEVVWITQDAVRFDVALIIPLVLVGFLSFLVETACVRGFIRWVG
jgi:hypothetical protein